MIKLQSFRVIELLLLLSYLGATTFAFSIKSQQQNHYLLSTQEPQSRLLAAASTSDDEYSTDEVVALMDRRRVVVQSMLTCLGVAGSLLPEVAFAYPQEQKDKENIVKGYERISYLVDNWEKETTKCGRGGDNPYIGCERTPEVVMEYLGFKNTNDPLFRADKTLLRLEVLVPDKLAGDYLEAVEQFNESAEEASGIAFVSSWGEANPGGGKDRVDIFIERSKKKLVSTQSNLKTIMSILNL